MAPGGIFEGFLSSGFCSSLEAGCCSVIGTTLTHQGRLEFADCQQAWVAGAQDVLGFLEFECEMACGGVVVGGGKGVRRQGRWFSYLPRMWVSPPMRGIGGPGSCSDEGEDAASFSCGCFSV